MAITRAQQAKQMLREGGMTKKIKGQEHMLAYITPGEAKTLESLGGQKTMTPEGIPAYPPPGEKGGSGPTFQEQADFKASQVGTPDSMNRANPYDVGFNVRDAQISKQYGDSITPTDDDGRIIPKDEPPPKKPEETNFQKFKRTAKKFGPFAFLDRLSNSKLARMNNAIQRQNYINSLDLNNPEEKEEYDRIMNQLGGLGMNIIAGPEDLEDTSLKQPMSLGAPKTTFKVVDGVSTLGNPGVDDVLGTGYDEYLNRFNTEDTGNRDDEPVMDPCKGPNPPAYCFVNDDTEDSTTPERNLAGLTPRIGGSIFDFTGLANGGRAGMMDGGIMNVEDLDREAFLLGGLAKGLKKAVRGVKKLVKSPIGKAALFAAGAGMAGFGPMKGLFASGKGLGFKNFMTNKLFGTLTAAGHPTEAPVRMGGLLNLIKNNPMESIFLTSALAGLATPKQDDGFNIDQYYAQNKLKPSQSVRGMGSEFDFYGGQFVADGGRIGYQEGSKEPVAKKTLPLLDMGGKEKDYRETGGFVDMGRMEKADDVPARLSKNEFVFTADAVRNAGEGDIDKGAEVMYNMMKNLEAGGEVSEESQGLEGAREMFQTSQRLGEVI